MPVGVAPPGGGLAILTVHRYVTRPEGGIRGACPPYRSFLDLSGAQVDRKGLIWAWYPFHSLRPSFPPFSHKNLVFPIMSQLI